MKPVQYPSCVCDHTRRVHPRGGRCEHPGCRCASYARREKPRTGARMPVPVVACACGHPVHQSGRCAVRVDAGDDGKCWCMTGTFNPSKETTP